MLLKRTRCSRFWVLPALSIICIVSICETGSARRASGGNKWGIPADGLWCKGGKSGATRRTRDDQQIPFASSIYNVPRQGSTPNFRAAVKMNGTGLIGANGDQKVTYNNSRPQPNVDGNGTPCSGNVGSVAGSAGICLTPFFSVAADPRYFSIGDVICVPGLAGRQVQVTPGRTISHTGCLIVGDKGAAIKGENRFDFFTGTAPEKGNPFTDFSDKRSCDKQFTVYRAGSSQASEKMAEIDQAWGMDSGTLAKRYQNAGDQNSPRRSIASRGSKR